MEYKAIDILADLHVHSVASVHAFNTIDEILSKVGYKYIAITDHVQDFGSKFMNHNSTQYINDVRDTFAHESFLLAGAEIDLDVPAIPLGLDLGKLHISLLSYHRNGTLEIDKFIKAIDEYSPTVLAHPYRYARPEDMGKWEEIVRYAASKGCVIEINETSIFALDPKVLQSLNCSFSLGSDAHHYRKVCQFEKSLEFANTYLKDKHIVNFDKEWLADAKSGKFIKQTKKQIKAWADNNLINK